ncbi:uncharacterized protein LOC113495610 [Trichoplusia ni]|uniref:Uncharacterized protein LOC113495610 n=1 Tax=Trichoplusia ni TaxID=7111 RepID=A0A7E5VPL1_TRINI|nr:uncharacterized protein LOC113495610 [Trichoplusia ni]
MVCGTHTILRSQITYFRVVDRLGMGRGPYTTVVRGGLKKNYIAVRIRSTYNIPVSVNIYVGCENKEPKQRHVITTTMMENTTDGPNGPKGASDSGVDGVTSDSGSDMSVTVATTSTDGAEK